MQEYPIFTYLVKDIGEKLDVTRFGIDQNDLLNMVSTYNQYKGDKNNFVSQDAKCKIQPFERFRKEPSWIIDRWWTDVEKQRLGIIESEDVITLDEFQNRIESLRESLLVANKELRNIIDVKQTQWSSPKKMDT